MKSIRLARPLRAAPAVTSQTLAYSEFAAPLLPYLTQSSITQVQMVPQGTLIEVSIYAISFSMLFMRLRYLTCWSSQIKSHGLRGQSEVCATYWGCLLVLQEQVPVKQGKLQLQTEWVIMIQKFQKVAFIILLKDVKKLCAYSKKNICLTL